MKETMILLATKYGEYFNTHGEEKGFELLRFEVIVSVLHCVYNIFIIDNIEPIEQIPKEKKEKYFDISKRYFEKTNQRIRASKAAYTLELITSNY